MTREALLTMLAVAIGVLFGWVMQILLTVQFAVRERLDEVLASLAATSARVEAVEQRVDRVEADIRIIEGRYPDTTFSAVEGDGG